MKKLFSIVLSLLMVFSMTVAVSAKEYVSRSGWQVKASSERTSENFTADRVIDGDDKTYWHTDYVNDSDKDEAPFYLTFYLPQKTTVSGFEYVPRQGNTTGVVTAYNIYASEADTGEAILIYSGTFEDSTDTKLANFGFNIDVKTVIFEITVGKWGYGACAEFNLLAAEGSTKKTIEQANKGKKFTIGSDTASTVASDKEYVSRSGWKVKASSERISENFTAECVIDGDTNTYWHTDYSDSEKDEAPFYLTFTLPKKTTVSGFEYVPRQGNTTGAVTAYNIYASESDKDEPQIIYSGTFVGNKDTKQADFGFDIDVKTVVFEITEGKWGYGACAEFNLFAAEGSNKKTIAQASKELISGVDGKIKVKSRWTIKASSERLPHYPATNAIDGNTETYWHSNYTDDGTNILSHEENPHWIEVTLPEMAVISGFSYTPRAKSGTGTILDYEFYVSDTDSGEWTLIDSGIFANNGSEKEVKFPANLQIKRFKFQSISSGGGFGVIAEFDLFGESTKNKTAANLEEFMEIYEAEKLIKIPSSEMDATASSVWKEAHAAALAVDGIQKTAWHSHTDDRKKFPVTLSVDLGASHSVSEIIYYPRIDDSSMNGIWTDFNIWAGDDPEDLRLIKENAGFDLNLNAQTIAFDAPVEARYYEFEILDGHNGYATCGDIAFLEKASEAKKRQEKQAKYTLQIGSNEIKIEENDEVRTVAMDVAPYIDGGYTQIPLRGLLEEMGAEFTWDGEYSKITVKSGPITINMQIFNKLVTVTDKTFGEVRYTLRSVPQLKDSRTFVPLRFISENLGYKVTWNADTQEITIVK